MEYAVVLGTIVQAHVGSTPIALTTCFGDVAELVDAPGSGPGEPSGSLPIQLRASPPPSFFFLPRWRNWQHALGRGPSVRKDVRVQVPPVAPHLLPSSYGGAAGQRRTLQKFAS